MAIMSCLVFSFSLLD